MISLKHSLLGQGPQPDKTCESWKKRSRSARAGATHETKTGAAGDRHGETREGRKGSRLAFSNTNLAGKPDSSVTQTASRGRRMIWGLACAALLVSGCGMLKKKQPEPAASATQVATPPPPPVTPTPAPTVEVTVADDAVATPEDFEDEAFEKVSEKTYKAELDILRKEIEAK